MNEFITIRIRKETRDKIQKIQDYYKPSPNSPTPGVSVAAAVDYMADTTLNTLEESL